MQDQTSQQAQTVKAYPSARALSGQALDDSKAILNSVGHFLYREVASTGQARRYVTTSGKQIICEGKGTATVCKWA